MLEEDGSLSVVAWTREGRVFALVCLARVVWGGGAVSVAWSIADDVSGRRWVSLVESDKAVRGD